MPGARWNNSPLSASVTSTGNRLTRRREEPERGFTSKCGTVPGSAPRHFITRWLEQPWKGIHRPLTLCGGLDTFERGPVSFGASHIWRLGKKKRTGAKSEWPSNASPEVKPERRQRANSPPFTLTIPRFHGSIGTGSLSQNLKIDWKKWNTHEFLSYCHFA